VGLLHDLIMTAGYYLVTRREFNLTSVAVLLTVVGYSVNDTIVIYDRIREEAGKGTTRSLPTLINDAINVSMSRTLLTSGITMLSLVGLLIFGVGEIFDFAAAMLVGLFVGVYSTVFVASPMTIWVDERMRRRASTEPQRARAWPGGFKEGSGSPGPASSVAGAVSEGRGRVPRLSRHAPRRAFGRRARWSPSGSSQRVRRRPVVASRTRSRCTRWSGVSSSRGATV